MKNFLLSENFLSIVASILLGVILCVVFLITTTPKYWAAGSHDAKCEKNLYGESCHCYERLSK